MSEAIFTVIPGCRPQRPKRKSSRPQRDESELTPAVPPFFPGRAGTLISDTMDAAYVLTGYEPVQVYWVGRLGIGDLAVQSSTGLPITLPPTFRLAAPEGFSAGFPHPAHTNPGSLRGPLPLTRLHHRL